jgi:hypothetical protein
MAKKIIKTESENNTVQITTRGAYVNTRITAKGPLTPDEVKYLGAVNNPSNFDRMLRDIVIIFMGKLKDNGYPYRPSYKTTSNNRTSNKSLLTILKKEYGLEPLDTFYVFAEVIDGYHLMRLMQSKGASTELLIEQAFKLGNTYQKAIIFNKEYYHQSKVSKQPRTDGDLMKLINALAKSDMTAKEAFNVFIGDIDGKEDENNGKLIVRYMNEKSSDKTMTFKTFENKLSIQRRLIKDS